MEIVEQLLRTSRRPKWHGGFLLGGDRWRVFDARPFDLSPDARDVDEADPTFLPRLLERSRTDLVFANAVVDRPAAEALKSLANVMGDKVTETK